MNPRILVVDDEAPARERIGRLLTELNPNLHIDFANNGFEALNKINVQSPDILFLDIQMPGMTGFEVLQHLEKRNFHVIFQTAFDQFAIQAFEESACDYLLKPFEKERLDKALQKALKSIDNNKELILLTTKIQEPNKYIQKLTVNHGNKTFQLNTSDIIYMASQDHYTCIYLNEKEYISDLSLNHLEQHLDPKKFFRCHRSHIINIAQISTLHKGPQMIVELLNGMKLEVSRQNRNRIRKILLSFK